MACFLLTSGSLFRNNKLTTSFIALTLRYPQTTFPSVKHYVSLSTPNFTQRSKKYQIHFAKRHLLIMWSPHCLSFFPVALECLSAQTVHCLLAQKIASALPSFPTTTLALKHLQPNSPEKSWWGKTLSFYPLSTFLVLLSTLYPTCLSIHSQPFLSFYPLCAFPVLLSALCLSRISIQCVLFPSFYPLCTFPVFPHNKKKKRLYRLERTQTSLEAASPAPLS